MAVLISLKTYQGEIVVPVGNILYLTGHTDTTNTSSVTFLDGSRMHVEVPIDKLVERVWPAMAPPLPFVTPAETAYYDYDDPEPEVLEVEQEMLECDLRGWKVERYKGRWRAATPLLGDQLSIVVSNTAAGLVETARTLERDAMQNTAGDTA